MTSEELSARIDHTILKPEATAAEVHRTITEAIQRHFAAVCLAPVWVSRAAVMARDTGVAICSVAGFPHGTSKATLKAIEASSALKDGADEIDVVAHLPYLIQQDLTAARQELMEVVRAARATRRTAVVKVIVESAYLLGLGGGRGEQTIELACRAVRESGADFIKTSTGFHPAGGASVEAVRLMKHYADGEIRVKASGGIRTLGQAEDLIAAGADRLGMSASVGVLEELPQRT